MHVHMHTTCTLVRKGKVEGVCYPYCVVCPFCGWEWEMWGASSERLPSTLRVRKSWGATSFADKHNCTFDLISALMFSESRCGV